MKKIILLVLTVCLTAALFTGCGKTVSFKDNLDAYVKTMDFREGFTVLQLSDIHWSNGTQAGDDNYGLICYIKKVVAEAENHAGKIDLIEITGDTFMLCNKRAVKMFIKMMDEIGIPYAINWGNHDREGTYNPDWLSDKFENAPYSLYTEVRNDDVHERSNYVINLQEDGKTVWQIFNLDSGAGYVKNATDFFLSYDYLRQDQFEWLTAEHEAAGDNVPALCYYHICQADNTKDFEDIENGANLKHKFFKDESFGESEFAVDTSEVFVKNNVKGVFNAHAHANDYTYTDNNGIIYGMGVKTGTELYRTYAESNSEDVGFEVPEDFEVVGASLVTLIDTEGNFKLEHLYLNERDGGDFVLWVEY